MRHRETFDTTIPFGEPELMRASSYLRYLQDLQDLDADAARRGAPSRRTSSLSPSLQADLQRFKQRGTGSELLEVVAACLRHGKAVTIHLRCGERAVPLSVFAQERVVHCPMDLQTLIGKHLTGARVMQVEPALPQLLTDPRRRWLEETSLVHSLAPLLWQLALHGSRSELLPEIAGPAVYRVAPALADDDVPVRGAMLAAVRRLRRQPANLRELADGPGMDRERASRLLNALYLQAGLIVSRSHPDALRDGWFGGA